MILSAALKAADARNAVTSQLSLRAGNLLCGEHCIALRRFQRVFVTSVGKAAVAMAHGVAEVLPQLPAHVLVVTKAGHAAGALAGWEVIEASHPVPDTESLRAAFRIRETILSNRLQASDLLILAVSGGASALVAAPDPPLTLEDKRRTTELLLRAGADIHELNAVRKHLSFLKGGRLAAMAAPATVLNLLLSDVIGDPPGVIGSGLAAPDPSTFADALQILRKYRVETKAPPVVLEQLTNPARPETPKADDPVFRNVHTFVVGSNHLALEAAALAAASLGYRTVLHSSTLTGETRTVAAELTGVLRREMTGETLPVCLLAGGETTVTVEGSGKGGRNQEFALAAAMNIADLQEDVLVLSAGTDGTDGPTDAAGAIATTDTMLRAQAAGLDAADYLRRNDSYPFFRKLNDLIITGPTGTNVMDIQIMLAQRS